MLGVVVVVYTSSSSSSSSDSKGSVDSNLLSLDRSIPSQIVEPFSRDAHGVSPSTSSSSLKAQASAGHTESQYDKPDFLTGSAFPPISHVFTRVPSKIPAPRIFSWNVNDLSALADAPSASKRSANIWRNIYSQAPHHDFILLQETLLHHTPLLAAPAQLAHR